ncbi:MAG TPA: hypothetical protein VLY46_16315, partial [Usitatibacter sp.]|nr:hypothetical protein [Usitatibacter sp.]
TEVTAAASQRARLLEDPRTSVHIRAESLAALEETRDWLRCAGGDLPDPAHEAERQAAGIAAEVAHNVAVLWPLNHEPSFDATPVLDAALKARAFAGNAAARRSLCALRARCAPALARALRAPEAPMPADELPDLGDGPAFDPRDAIGPTFLPRAPFHFLGTAWRRRVASRQLAATSVRARAAQALATHFERVRAWHTSLRQSMIRIVDARIDALRVVQSTHPAESRLRLADSGPRPGAAAR